MIRFPPQKMTGTRVAPRGSCRNERFDRRKADRREREGAEVGTSVEAV